MTGLPEEKPGWRGVWHAGQCLLTEFTSCCDLPLFGRGGIFHRPRNNAYYKASKYVQ